MAAAPSTNAHTRRILVAGATGYIGRALVKELVARGFDVTALRRPPRSRGNIADDEGLARDIAPAKLCECELLEDRPLARAGLAEARFDAVFSCIASRAGGVRDAWRVERDANLALLDAAKSSGAAHFILLSAICVQKPTLAFQHAKLAFEDALKASGLTWTIVRPTAYFKSLAGQVQRVRDGKPFMVFGDGRLTSCKPIGERDLARYLVDCLDDAARHNAVLPIGGPGPAITPLEQGHLLFEALGRAPRFRRVPLTLLDVVIGALDAVSKVFPAFSDKAEFARIGRYYASESMLVWDADRRRYDASATPETGNETLADFYRRVAEDGLAGQDLGAHAVFDRRDR